MTSTDSDAEPDSSPATPAPRTPPMGAGLEHYPRSLRYVAATPQTSPPASPSLGLYSLGMPYFSPARRQFSSLLARPSISPQPSETEPSEHEYLIQDSKDVLVQRLNDLAAKLSKQDHIQERNVNDLHAKVDEMETALFTKDPPSKWRLQRSRPSSNRSERDSFWGSLTPRRMMPSISTAPLPMRKSSSTQTEQLPDAPAAVAAREPQMSPTEASLIVAEAQRMCKELEDVASSLRARQEETEHIHDLLITRAERAAQRIIYLEKRVKELESERNEGEMEMLNLQIQLKAIEVQCLSYVPKDADQELRESISAWKTEWSALKRKRARRRASANANEDVGMLGTPTKQPRHMASPR